MKAWILVAGLGAALAGPVPAAAPPSRPSGAVPAPADTLSGRPAGLAVAYTSVLQVEEPEKVADRVIARAESLGGWFSRRGKTMVELRVPSAAADSLLRYIEGQGVVADRNLSTSALSPERDELVSRLKARRDMLKDYYAMLKESSDSTVFTIQSEIVHLQTEIEETEGRILDLEDRMALARVTVHFRFQERQAPLATGETRFPWLNRLGLPQVMGRFESGGSHE